MARVPKVFFLLPVMTNHLRDQIYAELKSKQKSDLFASYVSMLLDLEPDVSTVSQYENKWLEEKRLTDRQKRQLRRQAFEYLQNKVKRYYSFFAFYHDLIKEAHLWRLNFLWGERERGSEWREKAGYFTPRSKPIYISRVWKQAKLLKALLIESVVRRRFTCPESTSEESLSKF
ncbi:MAG: hypothetical protein GXO48_02735 [Chlorobi bacterium]|nr:hypothetical protein [Chlorobiota bacterium]